MEGPPLASLSLTHVHYNPDDPVSYLCAWLSLVPQGLMVTYVTLIWATREAEVGLMFAGQLACEALNFGLKRFIKEERPQSTYGRHKGYFGTRLGVVLIAIGMMGKGYGMPSSHSQFLSFFAIYITLFLLRRHKPAAAGSKSSPLPLPSTATQHRFFSVLFLTLAASVASSRVYLSYHTPKQVIVGCAAGVASAIVWFLFTAWLRESGWLDWILDLQLAQLLRIRDLVTTQDLVESGWREWDGRRRKRKTN